MTGPLSVGLLKGPPLWFWSSPEFDKSFKPYVESSHVGAGVVFLHEWINPSVSSHAMSC